MDDNTRSHIKEELGLALGHLHRAIELSPNNYIGVRVRSHTNQLSIILDLLTKEVQSGE